MRKSFFPRVVGVVLLAFFLSHCGEFFQNKEAESAEVEPTFSSLWTQHFSKCADSCHMGGIDPNGGPDIDTKTKFYNAFVSKKPSASMELNDERCSTFYFISPGDPKGSLVALVTVATLYDQLNKSICDPGFNSHKANKMVPSTQIQNAIEDWIKDGARNN